MADISIPLNDTEQFWLERGAPALGPESDAILAGIWTKVLAARGPRDADRCSCGERDLDGYLVLYDDDGRRFHSTDNCGRAVRSSLHRAIGPATVNGRPIY